MSTEEEFNEDSENNEEMIDVDIWEFTLDNEEIDDLIEGLKELKETKSHFHFDLNESNELFIHHDDEDSDEEDGEELL